MKKGKCRKAERGTDRQTDGSADWRNGHEKGKCRKTERGTDRQTDGSSDRRNGRQ